MKITLTDGLREEYRNLVNTCAINPGRETAVEQVVSAICNNESRYQTGATALGIPWCFVGAIHSMEASLSFEKHLHNGDPLTGRTVHVPKGRPPHGTPPFTWEASAIDALRLRGLDKVTDWSLPGLLYQLEGYNGFGYRRLDPPIHSPYLWSFSSCYKSGKFVADGKFDPDAVSEQCGAAVILRRMGNDGRIQLVETARPLASAAS